MTVFSSKIDWGLVYPKIIGFVFLVFLASCKKEKTVIYSESPIHLNHSDSLLFLIDQKNNSGTYGPDVFQSAIEAAQYTIRHDLRSRYKKAFLSVLKNSRPSNPSMYSALDSFKDSIAEVGDSNYYYLLACLGYLDYHNGRFSESKRNYESYLSFYERDSNLNVGVNTYGQLSNISMILGDYALADLYHSKVRQQLNAHKDSIKISNYHWNSGLLDHLFGQYLEAIHHYHKATDFHPLNREEMYLAIAKSYLEMDSLDQARRFIDLYDETVQVRDTAQLITRSELLAKINYIEKDVNEMNRQLKQSVEFASKYRLKYDRELGKTYARAGKLYYKTNQLSKALQYTNYALETFLSGFEFDTVYEIPEVYWLEKEVWVPDMIGLKGKVALKQFQNTGNSYYLETAVKSLQTSIDYFQRLNNNLEEESQQRLTGYMYPLFETLIECILLGNQSNGEDEKEAIFTLMQQSRNYSLKQEVREKAALSSSRIDPSILDVLDQILDQTRELQSQIVDIDNQDSVSFLKASFYDLIFKKNSILDSIATSNLKFNAYRRVEEPISLEECQSKLADSSMVIQIFQGEKALYILSISKDTSLFKSIELDSALQYSIQKVSSIIKDFDYIRDEPAKAEKAYLDNSHKVYSALLEPFLSHPSLQKVDRLMFSVSGALSDLSFESLINKRSDDWTEAENYLISRYSISYITDIRQAFVRSLQAKQANHSFLGIGIEYNNETLKKIDSVVNDSLISRPENINIRGISIGPLAFAVKEVKYLQEINGGKVLINEKARKDKVIDLLKQADLIHFSAHAFSDNSDPAKSSILLYSSKNDDDFILTAAEIGKMNLKAHQIVLSACQTASGRYVKGEGVLSLARYFIFSGAESVVASKWSIPDQISFYIMRSYYEHLNLGFSKDKALRRAKLNFLKNDRLSSPLTRLPSYWSSFCIYGSTQPL